MYRILLIPVLQPAVDDMKYISVGTPSAIEFGSIDEHIWPTRRVHGKLPDVFRAWTKLIRSLLALATCEFVDKL